MCCLVPALLRPLSQSLVPQTLNPNRMYAHINPHIYIYTYKYTPTLHRGYDHDEEPVSRLGSRA